MFMKNILFTISILISSIILFSQNDIHTGITKTEFCKINPELTGSIYENTETFTIPSNMFGLEDEWAFRFENDTLTWIFFHKYNDSITKENFDLCLSSTEQIIAKYTEQYGNPDTTIVGDRNFVDPYEKWHWGYDVIEARWNNVNGMKLKVEFDFFGGKGVFNFMVIVNFFDKDYPYFN